MSKPCLLHANLIGDIITSTQSAKDNGLNSFSMCTLSVEDIDNYSNYEGNSIGLSEGKVATPIPPIPDYSE
jgi:hypothetical protein